MPEQEITIKLNVPEGYELTGEYRTPRYADAYLTIIGNISGCRHFVKGSRFILRKKWRAPDWIPDGAWVYQHGQTGVWWVARSKPSYDDRYGSGVWLDGTGDGTGDVHAMSIARLHNDTFSPPPVDCIQVQRSKQ